VTTPRRRLPSEPSSGSTRFAKDGQEQIQKVVKDAQRTLQKPLKSESAPDKSADGSTDNPTN
jgi:hypothetical protein